VKIIYSAISSKFGEIVANYMKKLLLSDQRKLLKFLLKHFESESKEKTIYKTLSELLKKRI